MAAAKSLLVMAGGERDPIERCRPVFETYANSVIHLGSYGGGADRQAAEQLAVHRSSSDWPPVPSLSRPAWAWMSMP